MNQHQIIGKLQRLKRKARVLAAANYYGREWRMIPDEIDKFVGTELGADARKAVAKAIHPGTITLIGRQYGEDDGVAPQWKADRVRSLETEIDILIRDIRAGRLHIAQEPEIKSHASAGTETSVEDKVVAHLTRLIETAEALRSVRYDDPRQEIFNDEATHLISRHFGPQPADKFAETVSYKNIYSSDRQALQR